MSKPKLGQMWLYSVDNNIAFTKTLRTPDGSHVYWVVSTENNGYFVWRGHRLDTKAWEDSDWEVHLKGLFKGKNEAIEACLLAALDEEASMCERQGA